MAGDANDVLGISPGVAQNIQWQTAELAGVSRLVAYLGTVGGVRGSSVAKTAALNLPSTGYTIMGWVKSPDYAPSPPPNTYFTLIDSQGVNGSQESAYILRYGPQGLNFQVSALDNYPGADANARNIKFAKTSDLNADVLAANRWYQIAITYDGTTIKGYVDGVALTAVGGANTALANAAPKVTTRTTGLGKRADGVTGSYDPANNGYVSDIRLYNRALSAEDIAALATYAPGAPTAVSGVAGNGQAVVSFTVPASNGGATITNYTVTATPVGGGSAVTASGTSSPILVNRLAKGTAYTFTVTATNSVGTGIASVASSSLTVPAQASTIAWAMGLDSSGQLGLGTIVQRETAQLMASGVAAGSAGDSHSFYLKPDGTLWATGRNDYGKLGDGTTTNRSTPVQVASGVA